LEYITALGLSFAATAAYPVLPGLSKKPVQDRQTVILFFSKKLKEEQN